MIFSALVSLECTVAERRSEVSPIVERAIEVLRELPPVDGNAVSRIVAAAARSRAQDTAPNADDLLPAPVASSVRYPVRLTLAAAAAIALAIGGVELWRATRAKPTVAVPSTASSQPTVPAAPASRDMDNGNAPIPTQFVFDGRAGRVTLVGDFNNWDARATPLEREPGSTLWSVTVPIQRGRHVYAFLVDSVWTVDKRAPVARDADFGVTGSVILVGRP